MKSIANVSSKLTSDNEFYTPLEPILELEKKLNLSKDKVIWCPFDTKDSNFVKVFLDKGYKVIYSHIDNGQDFYNYEPTGGGWDIIISNPPFTNKKGIISRCQKLGKPYILLFGSSVCFQNGFANVLNEHYLHFIYKPVKFESLNGKPKKFLCLWISNKNYF